jgi:hypothetical protein
MSTNVQQKLLSTSQKEKKEGVGKYAAHKISPTLGGHLVHLSNGAGPEGTTISTSNWSTTLNSCEG